MFDTLVTGIISITQEKLQEDSKSHQQLLANSQQQLADYRQQIATLQERHQQHRLQSGTDTTTIADLHAQVCRVQCNTLLQLLLLFAASNFGPWPLCNAHTVCMHQHLCLS